MLRISSLMLLCLLVANVTYAIYVNEEDLTPFTSPCDLTVTEDGSSRHLSWSAISGASYYVVGRKPEGGSTEGLAQVTNTSYDDTSWKPSECYEYVVIAYDGTSSKVCSAHVLEVGYCPSN